MDRLGAGRAALADCLGESGSAIWLMESRWILESCPHPAFNLAVRGRAVEKGSRVLGVVQDPCQRKGRSQARGLVGVFFWWSSCIRCWGRLDETAVSRVHFWLARAPSQARGGLRPLSAPGRRRRRPNPHIDSLSSPLTRPPLHPFPPLKLLACGHLDTHHETCASRDGLSGTASAETNSVRDAISRPVPSVGQASGWDVIGLPVDTPTIGAAVLERTGMGMAKEK